ncbi:hypothetical protein KDW_12360 [Dictyobacter vulcani]|uniref:Uncharacterized protein n=1 Tax=Dictyobacter vulcani TaxID=2607529 RepID=A0A5J4KDF7_9CHLR|nr:hypothetical protein [Dictyobacter vulcani]GER87074.1 hypothetical protein KDW_12360 [Dictyobacter vulcani]
MDRDDEKLTLENVDEQIEQYLSQPRTSTSETKTPLARTTHNLHDIYAEQRRLEQAWARINNHISALNADNDATIADLSTIQPSQAKEKKARPVVGEESSHPILQLNKKRSQKAVYWKRRMVGFGVTAAVILLAIFLWPTISYLMSMAR